MEENHGKLFVPPIGTNIVFSYLPSAGVWRWNQATVF